MKRNTWQREAVREALEESDGFVSAQSLHASLKGTGSTVGLATVYRALADLCGRAFSPHTWTNGFGLVANLHLAAAVSTCPYLEVPLDPPGWTPGRRDWLLGTTVEIAADEVEEWAQRVAAQHGFTRPQHVVDVFGYCPECSRASG